MTFKLRIVVAGLLLLFGNSVVEGQSIPCECKKFPYFVCNGVNGYSPVCTDNPYSQGNPPLRRANPNFCMRLQSGALPLQPYDNGDGNGTIIYAIPIDPIHNYGVNSDNGEALGDWFKPVNALDPQQGNSTLVGRVLHVTNLDANTLENNWVQLLQGCILPNNAGFTLPPIDNSCCATLILETDPSFFTSRTVPGTTTTLNPSYNGNVLVYTQFDGGVDYQTCTIKCSVGIYLNCCDQFFSSDPFGKPQTHLENGYSLTGGDNHWLVGDGLDHIPPDGVGRTFDFQSIWYHEMGHALGLPERYPANMIPCGQPDPSSLMNGPLASEQTKDSFSSDDCCWIRKLYYPNTLPRCATDGVASKLSKTGSNLLQSYPNPTNGNVKLSFTSTEGGIGSLEVYVVLGRKIVSLLHEEYVAPGEHTFVLQQEQLVAGNYIYVLHIGSLTFSKTLTILK